MNPRSIRRAAERKASKLARKTQSDTFAPADLPDQQSAGLHYGAGQAPAPDHFVADLDFATSYPNPEEVTARLRANRANAQLSTGPRTFEGKNKVSLNALKTGLTGRTVLLPTEDAAEYRQYLCEYESELQPVGVRERDLTQSIADTMWRLRRVPGLEMAVFALGRIKFAGMFDSHVPIAARRHD